MRLAIPILLGVALVFLQYRLWVAPGSLADVHRMQGHAAELQSDIDSMQARNAAIEAEVQALRGADADALEARARQYLGLVRDGEEFFLVVEARDARPQ